MTEKLQSAEYLDAIRRRHKLPSDYAVSKLLGVGVSRISNYRNGRANMDDGIAPRVAELLGDSPLAILAELHASRADTAFARDAFRELAALARREYGAAWATKKPPRGGLVSGLVAEDGIEPPTRGFSSPPASTSPAAPLRKLRGRPRKKPPPITGI